MIIDYLENIGKYSALVPNLEEGMQFVQTLLDKAPGRYDGANEIYANVQEGDTYDISGDKLETHEKYLDVQMVFKGREFFQWEGASKLEVEAEYDPATDFKFYKGEGKNILAEEGMFYILFPQDAHKCRGKVTEKGEPYRKIVLKLPICK